METQPLLGSGESAGPGVTRGVDVGGRDLGLQEKDGQDDGINNDDFFCFCHICYFFMPALRARCCGDVTAFFS